MRKDGGELEEDLEEKKEEIRKRLSTNTRDSKSGYRENVLTDQ